MFMDFSEFDKSYAREVKDRWGDTQAYKEFSGRKIPENANDGMMAIIAQFGKLKALPPDCEEIQIAVKGLQKYINDNFYTCTDEILAGLGQMYVADERFKNNINTTAGEGTAEFLSKAIDNYCKV